LMKCLGDFLLNVTQCIMLSLCGGRRELCDVPLTCRKCH
jgi:hypothetical protein